MVRSAVEHPDTMLIYPDDPADLAGGRTIVDVLEYQARRTPNKIAITFADRDLTYAELHAAADAMARSVAAQISGPEPLVGLCIARNIEMVICLLGILKAGAAYLPLDASLPKARARQIVAEANPVLIVTPAAIAMLWEDVDVAVLELEDISMIGGVPHGSNVFVPSPADQKSLAYVLYTSGSTGRPKGVEVTHGSVLNLLASCRQLPGMGEGDVTLALARMTFDVAVLELFLPLSCGARLVLLPDAATRDPFALAEAIDRYGATVVQAPPALWQAVVDIGWRGRNGLRAWTGAEALSRRLADRLLPLCDELWNCYGLTETTVISTIHRVEAGSADVPIGRPIAGTSIAILDEALRPVAEGQDGELCIGGASVARGYRGRPELTAERFVTLPGATTRLYRTGDLVRLTTNGLLEYLGRIDDQVKLRGFRVEPGEVEKVLAGHPAVSSCVIHVWPDAIGQNALCAYVVRLRGADAPEAALKTYLRERLPDYMVPQRVIFLAGIPLTPNAKIDRAALPMPGDAVQTVADAPTQTRAFTPTESRLASIWQSLLGPFPIDLQDDFFDLGGYSLMTVHLMLEVENAFARELSLTELLSNSSLASMAALIARGSDNDMSRRIVSFRPEGRDIPLYWLDAGPLLRPALRAVGGNFPVFGLNLTPQDERLLLSTNFDITRLGSVIARFLRDVRGDRPFHLGGWCRWGIVALEVARQLEATGYPVRQLILLDADLPCRLPDPHSVARRFHRWATGIWKRPLAPAAEVSPRSFSETVGLLSSTYNAHAYAGDVAIIQPAIRKDADRAITRWSNAIRGQVFVQRIAGDHASMVHEKGGAALGAAIRTSLETDSARSQSIIALTTSMEKAGS